MGSIPVLATLLKCDALFQFPENKFTLRDQIKAVLANHLLKQETSFWLNILEPADIWCANVLNYQQLFAEEGFKVLDFIQERISERAEEEAQLEGLLSDLNITFSNED